MPLVGPARNLVFLALACPQIWLGIMFKALEPTAPLSIIAFYTSRGIFLLLLAAVILLLRIPNEESFRALSWPLAICMGASPLLGLAAGSLGLLPARALGLVAAVVGGSTLVFAYLQCIFVYHQLNVRQVITYTLLSFALASVVRFALELMPLAISTVAVAPLPLLCVLMCRRALALIDEGEIDSEADPRILTSSFRRLTPVAVELAIYGLVVGLVRVSSGSSDDDALITVCHLFFRTVFPLLALWLMVMRQRYISLSMLFQLTLLFMVTALLLCSAYGGVDPTIVVIATTCTRTTIIILLWLMLALLTKSSRLHPYVIFAGGWALYMLSIAAGMAVTNAIGPSVFSSHMSFINLSYVLVVSTVLLVTFLRGDRQIASEGVPSSSDDPDASGQPVLSDQDYIDSRCQAIGEQKSLTPREVEIMQYIGKGRSKGYIAEALGISENTVRGYSKNLYVKLDIHSRQELLDMIWE